MSAKTNLYHVWYRADAAQMPLDYDIKVLGLLRRTVHVYGYANTS